MPGLKQLIRRRLTDDQLRQAKKVYRFGQRMSLGALHPTDLRRIGETFSAGKYDWYYPAYERHFGPLRRRPLGLLEIGIGGYETAEAGGGSLRMWECYFPRGRIHGIDIYDKSPHDAGRVRTYKGSQVDEDFLRSVVHQMGSLDVIIDDGSHMNEHVIKTFQILFPLLDEHGLYVIEDTHSSYWESFGGSSKDLKRDDTTMGFVKNLLDSLNHREIRESNRPSSPFDTSVVEVHCYHNIVFIQKGRNNTVSLPH